MTSSRLTSPGRHALGIQLHLKLPQVAAETLDGRDSRNGDQSVIDSNSARSRSVIRSAAHGSASSVNSKISFSRPVRLEMSGGSVPAEKLPLT